MSNADVLKAFVGHPVALRPAAGREAARSLTHRTQESVVAQITGTTERAQLRLETDDMKVFQLKDRAVFAEPTPSATLFSVQGMLDVLPQPGPPVLCLLTPFDHPGVFERRQWIRVPTVLPVRIRALRSTTGDDTSVETVSVDLSGGGIKIRDGSGTKVGSWVQLSVELPSGPVEIAAEVLETGNGGATRLRFLGIPESVHSRIVRHVFHIQVKNKRRLTHD